MVAGSIGVIAISLTVSARRPLSSLEAVLFNVLMTLLGIVGTVLVSVYFARRGARSEYEQLARPALRRVVQLNRSVGTIRDAIKSKQASLGLPSEVSGDVVREWLDTLDRLMEQHGGQLTDAVSDWRELLPQDYERLIEESELSRLRTLYEEKLDDLDARQASLARTQEQQTAEAAATAGSVQSDIARVTKELQELKQGIKEREANLALSGGQVIDPAILRDSRNTLVHGTARLSRLRMSEYEVQIGLALSRLGCEPISNGRFPDFVVNWQGHEVGIEIKNRVDPPILQRARRQAAETPLLEGLVLVTPTPPNANLQAAVGSSARGMIVVYWTSSDQDIDLKLALDRLASALEDRRSAHITSTDS